MAGSTTRERASSWPESHHYRPFDKPDKTHKECLSLVSLSSKGRAFPPSLLPASVGILMFLSLSFSSAHQRPERSFSSVFVLFLSLSLCARASFHWCGRGYACVGLSVCTIRVSLRGITGPTDAINYATASRAQLRRRLVLIISPFGGPLEIFANSRPAGDTMEILRCRVRARYDRSRGGERGSHVPSRPVGVVGPRTNVVLYH